MKKNLSSRLETFLLQIWYGGHQPAIWHRAWLNTLECVYKCIGQLSRHRTRILRSRGHTAPPLLVIGNLIAGGAGKTPLVMAVCKALTKKGFQVGIVSSGYGRSQTQVLLLEPGHNLPSADQVGDEPLYLCTHTHCPIAVASKRAMAVEKLIEAYPDLDLIVSDDGLQHIALRRQIEWVVFDSRGHGNGRLLPAGPLREPLDRLAFVDAVLATNTSIDALAEQTGQAKTNNWHRVDLHITGFRHACTEQWIEAQRAAERWNSLTLAAFSGIANPKKFFHSLNQLGIDPEQTMALPDHHDYPGNFCDQFSEDVLITTGKDAVKLIPPNPKLWVAEIDLELPPALLKSLEDCIGPTID